MKKFAILSSKLLSWIWSFFPAQLNLHLGRFLAFLWTDVFRIRKNVLLDNISLVFPNYSDQEKWSLARKSMQNLCRSFFDVIHIPSLNDAWIEENVQFHGLENLNEESVKNQGVFFLSLHLGSGDLATAIISRKIKKVFLITKRFKNVFLDQFWFSLRGAGATQFIDAHSKRNAFDILSAIKDRAGVIFVLDQFMGKPYGIETLFFGKKTGTAYGLALFVKKSKAPVIPIYTYWGKDAKLHIIFSERIDLAPFFGDDDVEYRSHVTMRFNTELEKIIRLHPEHWMWVHRRWKDFE